MIIEISFSSVEEQVLSTMMVGRIGKLATKTLLCCTISTSAFQHGPGRQAGFGLFRGRGGAGPAHLQDLAAAPGRRPSHGGGWVREAEYGHLFENAKNYNQEAFRGDLAEVGRRAAVAELHLHGRADHEHRRGAQPLPEEG
jgi:hypothetical protein